MGQLELRPVEHVPLVDELVHGNLVGGLNNWLSADRAGVVVIRPSDQARQMEDMLWVARERDNFEAGLELNEANWAITGDFLVAERL